MDDDELTPVAGRVSSSSWSSGTGQQASGSGSSLDRAEGADQVDAAEAALDRDEADEPEDFDVEGEAGSELLARVRELSDLQRQLVGLQRATASLQAAATSRQNRGQQDRSAAQARSVAATAVAAAAAERRGRGLLGVGRRRRHEEGADDDEQEVHPQVTCDGCHQGPPLVGRVMHCLDCEDFDLCQRCFSDLSNLDHPAGHRFQPRPASARRASQSQFLLQMLESAMLSEALRRSVEADRGQEDEAARVAARGAEVLSRLPRQAWSPEMHDAEGGCGSECALCLEEYEAGEEVLKLPCGHFFHENCVRPWFAKSLLCPLCQRETAPPPPADGADDV